jgi:type III secretion protein T
MRSVFPPEYIDAIFSALLALMIAIPRTLMVMRSIPIFLSRTAPMRIRTATSVVMAMPVAVGIYYELGQRTLAHIELIWLISKEVLIGFLLGFLISLPFWILQILGTWVDQQRGNNMFPNSPGSDPDALPTGEFMRQTGIIIFIHAGFLASCFNILLDSYSVWPALNPVPPFDQMRLDLVIKNFSNMFNHAVLYSAPIIIALLLVELGFALLSIYAPQMQVSIATPALKSLLGMFLIMLSANTIWYMMDKEFYALKDVNVQFNQKPSDPKAP